MKKVFKYGTGQPIPEGAVYLSSFVEEINNGVTVARFVWHYFLVDVKETD